MTAARIVAQPEVGNIGLPAAAGGPRDAPDAGSPIRRAKAPDSANIVNMTSNWKFITSEMEAVVNDFGGHHLKQRLRLPSGPLYHYTSGDSLIKILESGELWGTQAACMNDAKELVYTVERLAERVRLAKAASAGEARLEPLFRAVDDLIAMPNANAAPLFLSCFSERDDDLSQWRGYGSGENGYSIGFDATKLRELGAPKEVYLMPIDYDEGRMNLLLDDVIKWLATLFLARPGLKSSPSEEDWAEECANFWLTNLSMFAIGIKHKSFQDEREWRLFQSARLPEDLTKFQFRQRSSFMSRHMPLHIPKPLPIVSVRVGPCRHPELSKVAVGDLLLKSGYKLAPGTLEGVAIKQSEVPYRQS